MSGKMPHHLLLDSEASLRFADSLVAELREEPAYAADALTLGQDLHSDPIDLPKILLRAHAEISYVLESLRRSRGILERTTLERVQMTQAKLREVSSATEHATIGMLDGLDQALAIVDRLDANASRLDANASRLDANASRPGADGDDDDTLRAGLRERLHGLITSLQFQDVTAQQLNFASSVLEDLEGRMAAVAALIDQNLAGLEHATARCDPASGPGSQPFDSAASTLGAETRQAVADEIFITR